MRACPPRPSAGSRTRGGCLRGGAYTALPGLPAARIIAPKAASPSPAPFARPARNPRAASRQPPGRHPTATPPPPPPPPYPPGITVNQLKGCVATDALDAAIPLIPAILCTAGTVTVPAAASVYNEFGMKKHMDTSVHLQNFFL